MVVQGLQHFKRVTVDFLDHFVLLVQLEHINMILELVYVKIVKINLKTHFIHKLHKAHRFVLTNVLIGLKM